MTPTSKWCVVANVSVPALSSPSQYADLGELQVYYRGPQEIQLAAEPPFTIDVRTLSILTDAASGGTAPGPIGRSVLQIAPDLVTVRISALNEDPVYYAANRMRGTFAYFTDLFLAPVVLPALGIPAELINGGPAHERGTLVHGVNRLRHGIVACTRRSGGHWLMDTRDEYDTLGSFRSPHREDPLAAGEAQLEALAGEIARIDATTPRTKSYATLLSGGIDSGTVTYLAATSDLDITPYSVATPWGDELTDAGELCAELGLDLAPIQLSEDDIIASIPDAVRWLGVADPEVIEVALTATSVQRLESIPKDRVLLTGYGSDLINAGLYRPFDHRDELIDQVIGAVDRTRRSNELANRMPLAYDTTTHHPFWSWPVMRVALETAPECKVREGREKFHLRTAMGTRVPQSIAWRKKIAVHHGGGLQEGVMRRLEQETGSAERKRVYLACFAELFDRVAEGEWEPNDPWHLLEGALRRLRTP
ncbi:asparagine synthase-related protein [Streptomyces sp. NPDC021212]|uniref:asparagine synthase-related protein n=1 Tax=Streptomyces sp. NPDC021212 TaxID=3365118 RepID=UPI00379B1036